MPIETSSVTQPTITNTVHSLVCAVSNDSDAALGVALAGDTFDVGINADVDAIPVVDCITVTPGENTNGVKMLTVRLVNTPTLVLQQVHMTSQTAHTTTYHVPLACCMFIKSYVNGILGVTGGSCVEGSNVTRRVAP
jgi:hypothetical protein